MKHDTHFSDVHKFQVHCLVNFYSCSKASEKSFSYFVTVQPVNGWSLQWISCPKFWLLSFSVSTWTAESVSNSSRKQRVTFFNWLATPNEVKSSCSCSPWQSHETSHSGSEITYFHCLKKDGKSVVRNGSTWTHSTVFYDLLTGLFCQTILSKIIQKDNLSHAFMVFKDFQYFSMCNQRLCSPCSDFTLPITNFLLP